MNHYCYFLFNELNNSTYNGYTINLERRRKQHNGLLAGGAKSTKKYSGHWNYLAIITTSTFTKNTALSLEWKLRYPTNKKPRPNEYKCPLGRLKSIPIVLDRHEDVEYTIYVHEKYYDYFKTLKFKNKNIKINLMSDLT